MSSFNSILSFGPSIVAGDFLPPGKLTLTNLVANKLNKPYLCLAERGAANTGILRQILSHKQYNNDLILVMWSTTVRYEFRNEDLYPNGWYQVSPRDNDRFSKEWFRGPGQYEYTEVYTTLRDIITAKQFLESKNLNYIFMFDYDDIIKNNTWNSGDTLIENLKSLLPYNNILWFDNTGFTNWAKEQNFVFENTHPGPEAHESASRYILQHLNKFIEN